MFTASEVEHMNEHDYPEYARVLKAVYLMRTCGLSLAVAAKEAGTSTYWVLFAARSALKRVGDRWEAKPSDCLPRRVDFVRYNDETTKEFAEICDVVINSSKVASQIREYKEAVRRHFAETGNTDGLQPFAGKSIVDAFGSRHKFVTDPVDLQWIADSVYPESWF